MTEETAPTPSLPISDYPAAGSAPTPPLSPPPETERPSRDPTFDILKGIAITEVVLLHVCGFSSRNFATKDSWLWWALSMSVAVLQVCVPTFFISSAIVAAMSAARKETIDWGKYYGNRFIQTLWPYVQWTFIYLALRYFVAKAPGDLKLEESTILGQTFVTPHVWAPDFVGYTLMWGKSQFHMYFLAVLMQFIAIFPLVFLAIRRANLGLGWILLIASALQGLVYFLNVQFWQLKAPASTVTWYIVPLAVGVAIGLRWKEWPSIWRVWRWPLVAIGMVGAAAYLYLRGTSFAGTMPPGTSWLMNGGFVLYTLALGLATVAYSFRLAKKAIKVSMDEDSPSPFDGREGEGVKIEFGSFATFWKVIGERSLAIFFIHPVVLQFLGSARVKPTLDQLPASPLITFLIVALSTWIIVEVIYLVRLGRLLFGR